MPPLPPADRQGDQDVQYIMTKVSPRSGRIGFFLSFFNFRVRAVESKSSRTIFVQPPIAQYRELARSRWGWWAAVRRRTLGGCGYAQIPLERGLEKSLCFSLSFFLGFLCSSLACGIFTSQFIFGCIFFLLYFSLHVRSARILQLGNPGHHA